MNELCHGLTIIDVDDESYKKYYEFNKVKIIKFIKKDYTVDFLNKVTNFDKFYELNFIMEMDEYLNNELHFLTLMGHIPDAEDFFDRYKSDLKKLKSEYYKKMKCFVLKKQNIKGLIKYFDNKIYEVIAC